VAELEANKAKVIALCEEAEQLRTLSGAELVDGIKKLPALREAFNAIGELPKANSRELNFRFEQALEQAERRLQQQRARDKAQAWTTLLDAGNKIRQYRLAQVQKVAVEESAALKDAVQSFIGSVEHWPKGGLAALKSELAKETSFDIAANETALRTLCIRAEIATDSPTPESDQAFRRNYQVQRLMQSMGQGTSVNQNDLDAMIFEWIAVGATSDAVHAELLQRFMRCREKAMSRA
jgi:hypothetical protein